MRRNLKRQRGGLFHYDACEPRQMLATIELLAAGVMNDERISLQIDQQTVRTWDGVGGDAYAGQFVTLTHTLAGNVTADQVRIVFENDLYDPDNGLDRNVRIDALIIDGERFETEAPTVFSTGTWKPEDGVVPGFRQSEFLHTDGYFQYATDATNQGSIIEIRAAGSHGAELFQLLVDEVPVKSFAATQQFANYSWRAPDVVTPDRIRVQFTNDLYDPDNGIDYNLIVDYISIDGTIWQTEAPDVYSTGTWLPADGITPGFRLSETLHTNGYFAWGQSTSPGIVSLENSVINVDETDNSVALTIVRNNGTDGIVTVDYRTVALTASDGVDFVGTSGTVTMVDGQSSAVVVIDLLDDTEIEPDEQFSFTIDNVTGGATLLVPRTATITIDDDDSIQSAGTGLRGEYFSDRSLVHRFLHRVDPSVNFDWGNGAPATGMSGNNFSVRWTGQIEPTATGTWTFQTRSDDGVRLWVDNQLIIDQWNDHAATVHTGQIDLAAGVLYDIRMEYYENAGQAVAELSWTGPGQPLQIIPASQLYPADPPPPDPGDNLVTQTVVDNLIQPTAIDFSADGGLMFIAEQRGIVRVVDNGVLQATPVLDFQDRINGTRDRGLLDIAVHPDLQSNPYLYLLYTYDPPQVNQYSGLAGPDGRGNRAGRLTRVALDAGAGYTAIVPGSEVVLVGGNSTWDNFNAFANSTYDFNEPPAGILPDGSNLQDFIATDSESHTIGSVEFGADGKLYVSIGDGTSYNQVDPRTERVQDIDNLSGKILRIDPVSGAGLTDNPFFNGDASANRSKVFQSGLRNPFRITVHPTTGQLYIGDVGWTQWEEINAGPAGANFGWPWYEGGSGVNLKTGGYRNLPAAADFYASNPTVQASLYALNHANDGINAVVLGDVYTGNVFPSEYRGDLFFNDLGQGIVRNISFDANGNMQSVETFTTGARNVVQMVTSPQGEMYFVDIDDGLVGRWTFVNSAPQATAAGHQDSSAPLQADPDIAIENGSPIVAVVDSGVDLQNAAIAGALWVNAAEVPEDGIDNDGNGLVDDVHGYDFVDRDWEPFDLNGHGTAVAEVIQRSAEGARLMPLRVLDASGEGRVQDVADAIYYAVNQGADVVALTVSVVESPALDAALQYAELNDVLVIAAAGNDDADQPVWSAAQSAVRRNVLSVGAVDQAGQRIDHSNRVGDSRAVQLDALGLAQVMQSDGSSTSYVGTSVAAARVAGAAAHIVATGPSWNAAQIREILVSSGSATGVDSDSRGQLDRDAAVALATRLASVRIQSIGSDVNVSLTNERDVVQIRDGGATMAIDGVTFNLPAGQRVYLHGLQGRDRLVAIGSDGDDSAWIDDDIARLTGSHSVVIGRGFESVQFFGLGGFDFATIGDTPEDDLISGDPESLHLVGGTQVRGVDDFESVVVQAGRGSDTANLSGSVTGDRFYGDDATLRLRGETFRIQVDASDSATVDMGDGFDVAIFRGTLQSDSLSVDHRTTRFVTPGSDLALDSLERTTAYARGGLDQLSWLDGPARDVVNARAQNFLNVGEGYDTRAYGFETTRLESREGNDRATFTGSTGDDVLNVGPDSMELTSGTDSWTSIGFPTVLYLAGQGHDRVSWTGSSGDDEYYFSPLLASLVQTGRQLTVRDAEEHIVDGGGGSDSARLVDGAGDDRLELRASSVSLSADDYQVDLSGFETVTARSLEDDGVDQIIPIDPVLDYAFASFGDWQ